jgi:hypothetical protein
MNIEEILSLIGDSKKFSDDSGAFREDCLYFDDNYEEIRREYPDQWVAIFDKNVVCHNKTLKGLMNLLEGIKCDLGRVYIQRTYFNEEPPLFALFAA